MLVLRLIRPQTRLYRLAIVGILLRTFALLLIITAFDFFKLKTIIGGLEVLTYVIMFIPPGERIQIANV